MSFSRDDSGCRGRTRISRSRRQPLNTSLRFFHRQNWPFPVLRIRIHCRLSPVCGNKRRRFSPALLQAKLLLVVIRLLSDPIHPGLCRESCVHSGLQHPLSRSNLSRCFQHHENFRTASAAGAGVLLRVHPVSRLPADGRNVSRRVSTSADRNL